MHGYTNIVDPTTPATFPPVRIPHLPAGGGAARVAAASGTAPEARGGAACISQLRRGRCASAPLAILSLPCSAMTPGRWLWCTRLLGKLALDSRRAAVPDLDAI